MKEIIARLQTEAAKPKEKCWKYERTTAAPGEQQTVVLMGTAIELRDCFCPRQLLSSVQGISVSIPHVRSHRLVMQSAAQSIRQCCYRGFLCCTSYMVKFCKNHVCTKKKLQSKYVYLP